MAKSSYFSNSAKLLAVVTAVLFTANFMTAAGSFWGSSTAQSMGKSLSSLALYVGLVLCFVAFNGEGVGHKRYRNRSRKKITDLLKLNLFFCFFLNFVKGGIEYAVMTTSGALGVAARIFMSLVSTVGSYGFLLFAVSVWYVFRDSEKKSLLPLETAAFVFGLFHNVYKLFYYATVKYGVTALGELFNRLFSNGDTLKILCLLQFFFDILMFVQVCVIYGKQGEAEQEILDKNVTELPRARNVYKDEGFGIDTMDDDFLS